MRTNRAITCQPVLLGCLVLAGMLTAAQTGAAPAGEQAGLYGGRTMYRVTSLGDVDVAPGSLNNKNQVGFTFLPDFNDPRPSHAYFFDGARVRDIGSLAGGITRITGLNDAGRVTGVSLTAAGDAHAFVWSAAHGMHDIGLPPGTTTVTTEPAINGGGDVSATAANGFEPTAHAFVWSRAHGVEDLGSLSGAIGGAYARALNGSGTVAGMSQLVSGDFHAFTWTRSGGMRDIGATGVRMSDPVAIGADGLVAGNAWLPPGNVNHIFVWTRKHGMRDLGAAGGVGTWMYGMSANGQIAAVTTYDPYRLRALTWSPAGGLVHLGTLGGAESYATAANTKGQVTGGARTKSDDYHAFVWTAREGMIDLNRRLVHAPAGLELYAGVAINDNGAIVAAGNTGKVLLTPYRGGPAWHVAGPIAGPDLVRAGATFDASVDFVTDAGSTGYKVLWSWGDGGSAQTGNTRLRGATGNAAATHVYTTPGVYTVTANIVDAAGRASPASRTIVVYDPAHGIVGGAGALLAQGRAPDAAAVPAGRARFAFAAPAATGAKGGQLSVTLGSLRFASTDLTAIATSGAETRFAGSATLNGRAGYRVTLETAAGAARADGTGRVALRIAHTDPKTGAEVADFDNHAGAGPALVEGSIVMQR